MFFQKCCQINEQVDLQENEGWRKYMIGNFDSFMSAHNFSLKIREKIPDAFVVAYRNSERIPLTEAVSGVVAAN